MANDLILNFSDSITKTTATCNADENYLQYSVREKMLAWIFTLLQQLQQYNKETEVSAVLKSNRQFKKSAAFIQLKQAFYRYTDELILEGTNSGEIQSRIFIANYYKNVLWNVLISIMFFWINDKSDHKENTDVMVEKTVHFAFDLLAPSAIDSGIDLIQNIVKLRNK